MYFFCLVTDLASSGSALLLQNSTSADVGGNDGGDGSAWVSQARFAIEGVTQGLVGIFGLIGNVNAF
jgi:hypothetical protein